MFLAFKVVTWTITNEIKEQRGGFLCMLLVDLGAYLSKNILAFKGTIAVDENITF